MRLEQTRCEKYGAQASAPSPPRLYAKMEFRLHFKRPNTRSQDWSRHWLALPVHDYLWWCSNSWTFKSALRAWISLDIRLNPAAISARRVSFTSVIRLFTSVIRLLPVAISACSVSFASVIRLLL